MDNGLFDEQGLLSEVDGITEDVEQFTNVSNTLVVIQESFKDNKYTLHEAKSIAIAIEGLRTLVGMPEITHQLSTESLLGYTVSLEETLKDTIARIWLAIKNGIRAAIIAVKEFFSNVINRKKTISERLLKLKNKLKSVKDGQGKEVYVKDISKYLISHDGNFNPLAIKRNLDVLSNSYLNVSKIIFEYIEECSKAKSLDLGTRSTLERLKNVTGLEKGTDAGTFEFPFFNMFLVLKESGTSKNTDSAVNLKTSLVFKGYVGEETEETCNALDLKAYIDILDTALESAMFNKAANVDKETSEALAKLLTSIDKYEQIVLDDDAKSGDMKQVIVQAQQLATSFIPKLNSYMVGVLYGVHDFVRLATEDIA